VRLSDHRCLGAITGRYRFDPGHGGEIPKFVDEHTETFEGPAAERRSETPLPLMRMIVEEIYVSLAGSIR
jgi:hypothetical protein